MVGVHKAREHTTLFRYECATGNVLAKSKVLGNHHTALGISKDERWIALGTGVRLIPCLRLVGHSLPPISFGSH